MLPKFLSFALSKAQTLMFLGLPTKTKALKEPLMADLIQLVSTNQQEYARLLDTFPQELAVGPTELEELLSCTQLERRRWIKEGKIPVLVYRSFRKAGRDMEYPVHDRRVILHLSQEEIARWRSEHQDQVHVSRQAAAQVAVHSRKANQQTRQHFWLSWQQMIAEWKVQGSPELAAILNLAFWTTWASRWAKENQLKMRTGIKYAAHYAAQKNAWYARKNEALIMLLQTPYARLHFYRPPDPHKYTLHLCEEHYELKREGYYQTKWEFLSEHTTMVKQCPECTYEVEKDFYSLYYVEVTTEAFPELLFSFHTPYSIGKAWFPAPNTLPRVVHIEQDGLFRFGRLLTSHEKITYREQDVLEHFEQALMEVRDLCVFADKHIIMLQSDPEC